MCPAFTQIVEVWLLDVALRVSRSIYWLELFAWLSSSFVAFLFDLRNDVQLTFPLKEFGEKPNLPKIWKKVTDCFLSNSSWIDQSLPNERCMQRSSPSSEIHCLAKWLFYEKAKYNRSGRVHISPLESYTAPSRDPIRPKGIIKTGNIEMVIFLILNDRKMTSL